MQNIQFQGSDDRRRNRQPTPQQLSQMREHAIEKAAGGIFSGESVSTIRIALDKAEKTINNVTSAGSDTTELALRLGERYGQRENDLSVSSKIAEGIFIDMILNYNLLGDSAIVRHSVHDDFAHGSDAIVALKSPEGHTLMTLSLDATIGENDVATKLGVIKHELLNDTAGTVEFPGMPTETGLSRSQTKVPHFVFGITATSLKSILRLWGSDDDVARSAILNNHPLSTIIRDELLMQAHVMLAYARDIEADNIIINRLAKAQAILHPLAESARALIGYKDGRGVSLSEDPIYGKIRSGALRFSSDENDGILPVDPKTKNQHSYRL